MVAQADEVKNCCMCHVRMEGEPTGKDLIMDVFKNDLKIEACNDVSLENCKKFCLDTVSDLNCILKI